MKKKVLDVGQCGPDHSALRFLVESMGARLDRVALPSQALELLKKESYDLVFVNRKIDQDYSDGMELVKSMQALENIRQIPIMLISNFPEAQKEAVENGAVPGFGKQELEDRETRNLLARYLA